MVRHLLIWNRRWKVGFRMPTSHLVGCITHSRWFREEHQGWIGMLSNAKGAHGGELKWKLSDVKWYERIWCKLQAARQKNIEGWRLQFKVQGWLLWLLVVGYVGCCLLLFVVLVCCRRRRGRPRRPRSRQRCLLMSSCPFCCLSTSSDEAMNPTCSGRQLSKSKVRPE